MMMATKDWEKKGEATEVIDSEGEGRSVSGGHCPVLLLPGCITGTPCLPPGPCMSQSIFSAFVHPKHNEEPEFHLHCCPLSAREEGVDIRVGSPPYPLASLATAGLQGHRPTGQAPAEQTEPCLVPSCPQEAPSLFSEMSQQQQVLKDKSKPEGRFCCSVVK